MPGKTSFLQNYDASQPPYDAALALSIPRLIPLIVGCLELRAHAFVYTDESAYGAVQALREVQVSVINGVTIGRLDDIYRLVDTTMNGAEYIADEIDGQIVVTPPIPAAPAPVARSIHSRLERLEYLMDNFYNGGIYSPDFENPVSVRQQLADLLAAIQDTGQLDDEMLAELVQIAATLA